MDVCTINNRKTFSADFALTEDLVQVLYLYDSYELTSVFFKFRFAVDEIVARPSIAKLRNNRTLSFRRSQTP